MPFTRSDTLRRGEGGGPLAGEVLDAAANAAVLVLLPGRPNGRRFRSRPRRAGRARVEAN